MTSMLIGWLSSTPILASREGDPGRDELRNPNFLHFIGGLGGILVAMFLAREQESD